MGCAARVEWEREGFLGGKDAAPTFGRTSVAGCRLARRARRRGGGYVATGWVPGIGIDRATRTLYVLLSMAVVIAAAAARSVARVSCGTRELAERPSRRRRAFSGVRERSRRARPGRDARAYSAGSSRPFSERVKSRYARASAGDARRGVSQSQIIADNALRASAYFWGTWRFSVRIPKPTAFPNEIDIFQRLNNVTRNLLHGHLDGTRAFGTAE